MNLHDGGRATEPSKTKGAARYPKQQRARHGALQGRGRRRESSSAYTATKAHRAVAAVRYGVRSSCSGTASHTLGPCGDSKVLSHNSSQYTGKHPPRQRLQHIGQHPPHRRLPTHWNPLNVEHVEQHHRANGSQHTGQHPSRSKQVQTETCLMACLLRTLTYFLSLL